MNNKIKALLFVVGCIVVIGMSYQTVRKSFNPVYDATPQDEYVYDYQDTEVGQDVTVNIDEEVRDYNYLFESATTSSEYSNVIGTLAYESFAWYVPDWLLANWEMSESASQDGNSISFTPKGDVDLRKISHITFHFQLSTEEYNAGTIYDNLNEQKTLISEILLSKHADSMLKIGMEPETRIYHVQIENINAINDVYIIDGNGYTLRINFSADKDIFYRYATKIRDMIEGIGEVRGPQG